jgi:hypothetical protein
MNEILGIVVTTWGQFQVVRKDDFGSIHVVSMGSDLGDCLRRAAENLGHPIAILLKSGPM